MASDFFLKFDDSIKFDNSHESFEDAAEHAARDLRHIGRDSADLGFGFLKLIRDESVPPGSPAAGTVDLKIKLDDAAISNDLFKLGSDFLAASDAQHKIDIKEIPIIKVLDQSSPLTDGGGSTVVTDLMTYEADLKTTGNDFLNFNQFTPDLGAAAPGFLSAEFRILSFAYNTQSTDLSNIGNDFLALAKSPADLKIHGLSDALHKYGEDALALANDFKFVSADFLKIAQDFAPGGKGAGGGVDFNQTVMKDSADFIKLADDLKFMNADYKMFAADTIKLSDTLENAAHQLLPAVQKT
jgi:hypothetical protein